MEWSRYFCVWWFCFDAIAQVRFDTGAYLWSDINYTVGYNAKLNGHLKFSYRCTADGCVEEFPTISNISYDAKNNEFVGSVSGNFNLNPWLAVRAGASLHLYVKGLELVEGLAMFRIDAPLKIYGYYGNDCQDGDNDGKNEIVKGLFLDFNVGAALWMQFEVFNGSVAKIPLKINLPSWLENKYCEDCVAFPLKEEYKFAVVKHLYFYDLLPDGSTVFSPVVRLVSGQPNSSTVAISGRSCSPFNSAVRYEVDWGNGSVSTVEAGKSPVSISNSGVSDYVKITPQSDTAGRSFRPTETIVNGRGNAVSTPIVSWLIPVLSLL